MENLIMTISCPLGLKPMASSLIWGNDDGQGFGQFKKEFNKDKKKRRTDKGLPVDVDASESDTAVGGGLIIGSDEVDLPPEQPVDDGVGTEGPAADGSITVKPSELEALVARKAQEVVTGQTQDLSAQIAAQNEEFAADRRKSKESLDAAQAEVKAARAEAARLSKVLTVTGVSAGAAGGSVADSSGAVDYRVNYLTMGTAKEARGAAADFMEMRDNAAYSPTANVLDAEAGTVSLARDTRNLRQFIRENRDHLRRDMERLAKGNGLLLGADASLAGNTSGAAGSIPDGFLDYISEVVRMTHAPKFIWWQFLNFKIDLGQRPGQTILVPRFDYLDEPANEADFILDTAANSANLSADNQALVATTAPLTIKGYGLGLGTNVGNRAIAIPEFIMATSILELQGALNRNLGHHYYGFEDFMVRKFYREALYQPSNIFYNNAGDAVNDPAAIVDGSDGTMTEEYLTRMHAIQNNNDVPTLEDGKRIAVLCSISASQLRTSLGDKIQVPTETQLMEMTNILNQTYPGGEIDKVTQYMGCYCGYHCYETLSTSKGAAGSEGVYTGAAMDEGAPNVPVSLGITTPAAATVRDNYLFGPGAVGHGASMPMQIRQDDANQFQTKMRFIWRSIEGFGSLDVSDTDAAGAARSQQNRVYVARATDRIV